MSTALHPRDALLDPGEPAAVPLPVCDHYSGVELRMRKSLELQADMGPLFDVTLDGEDGAPVGGEVEHAHLMAELAAGPANRHGRVGVRLPVLDHPRFGDVLDIVVKGAGERLAYLVLPKPRGLADVSEGAARIDSACSRHGLPPCIPVHALVETHGALREVFAIAAHPRIECLSFGLMDFVSAHRGALPQSAMGVKGQFEHPLVVRAKLEIAAACHAAGKTPSHCVVTEFKHKAALQEAATRACREFGYTRMWSIHPDQIRPIVDAFSPTTAEVDQAVEIISAAQAAQWAPIRHRHNGQDQLHDRASYRYFWHVLERAHRTGQPLPGEARLAWFGDED
ncbi:citrate lyase beta subunit [Burkholderiales bacterium JOSHI_001]|nr:citrate lyase beta subunit [Burkholderiales bacterium JOSHI_001]